MWSSTSEFTLLLSMISPLAPGSALLCKESDSGSGPVWGRGRGREREVREKSGVVVWSAPSQGWH